MPLKSIVRFLAVFVRPVSIPIMRAKCTLTVSDVKSTSGQVRPISALGRMPVLKARRIENVHCNHGSQYPPSDMMPVDVAQECCQQYHEHVNFHYTWEDQDGNVYTLE